MKICISQIIRKLQAALGEGAPTKAVHKPEELFVAVEPTLKEMKIFKGQVNIAKTSLWGQPVGINSLYCVVLKKEVEIDKIVITALNARDNREKFDSLSWGSNGVEIYVWSPAPTAPGGPGTPA